MKKKKIVLFGASVLGNIAYKEIRNKYEIIFYCDNSKTKINKYMNNIKIISIDELKKNIDTNTKILITSAYYKEIFKQLMEYKFKNIYLFDYDKQNETYAINKLYKFGQYKNIKFRSVDTLKLKTIDKEILTIIKEVWNFNRNNFSKCKVEFKNFNIESGKIEIINNRFRIIGMNVSNEFEKNYLVGILYDSIEEIVYLPNYILNSEKFKNIKNLIKDIMRTRQCSMYSNKIIGIIDKKNLEEIKRNVLVYQWERAIPGTQFMPEKEGLLRIIERYKYAEKYMKNSIILEGACGYGYGAAYLSNMCREVHAVDISKENIEFAKNVYKHLNNIEWKVNNVCKLSYENNTFDIYTSFETMEHISLDQVEKYLSEAWRVLKNNGKFIISTPNKQKRISINNPFHIKEYTKDEFEEIIKKYFDIVDYYDIDKYVFSNKFTLLNDCILAVCTKK